MSENKFNILYVTLNVLGDPGANAAEIFPRLAVENEQISKVIVADQEKNRNTILHQQGADFLKLRQYRSVLWHNVRAAGRIARKARQEEIDIIHVFYRQRSVILVILLRIAFMLMRNKSQILVDHRSVNLARGRRGFTKKLANFFMQLFTHHLAGNPWAVETNHFRVFKPKHLIDLGYDQLPEAPPEEPETDAPRRVWFIGSRKPKNRKSEFLIEVFRLMDTMPPMNPPLEIHVAGPAHPHQAKPLNANPSVTFYGRLPRNELYQLLTDKPGVGVAFMNKEFHSYAPSLKFVEYAIMRFGIVASETLGLRTQASRMNLQNVSFAEEDPQEWAEKLYNAAAAWNQLEPTWSDADKWSYNSIFDHQVVGVYDTLKNT